MSGAGDDSRWRGGRGYDHGRPQGQRHHSGGYRDRQSGSHGHRNQMNNMTATATWTGPPSGPSREAHIPVRSFNSVELKDALRKDYKKGGQGEPQPVIYRPTGKDGNPVRPSGPWGSKRMPPRLSITPASACL
ncbi:hypothetical protein H112_02510 [Trichophyton rubrum D6]|uniref:Uncharacterized protein n=3 Tax=Trichophyton TaxID=5550 RepID=A0A080WHZ9_TRIRC|nr:uncharacterized protein TERG_06270 [Trichophyton rubrum CBS 118892]EZF25165.1 hypothetical protein H100_02511 [Trichophyton rubrum MR850]EZF44196.1 hypothetical protein H102_02505 [Trichophyton rubrum CBS 100081]EZF54848.1 hypothetical protein H103_02518 [Trichophyton rubrum CBS 288.86]EZF65457.1 hypothetical protein H104_02496 [Trichophyton rubrum CBS 289.86]EZF76085.1 hypothetical protein H105_02523 [Trichophyton soudanense CBS 452.61]EZF86756.1 hypothetical protein H110_02515 [Trichophy